MLQVGPGFEFMGRPKEMENHKPYLSWGCWNSQRPSHCWTFQLHALGAPVRTSVCCENASAFWPVVDCVDQKASQCWSRSNSPDWLKGCCRNQRERCCSKVFHSILKPCWCEWKKNPSNVKFSCLHQPGELEGGTNRATDPIWSSKVYKFERVVTKRNEPVFYYLHDGPKQGFIHKELLIVPPNTQLPPAHVV